MKLLLPLTQDEVGLLLVSSIAGEVLIQLDAHCKALVDVWRGICLSREPARNRVGPRLAPQIL